MFKTRRVLAALVLTAVIWLSGCTAGSVQTAAPQTQTETTGQTTETSTLPPETVSADECDIALPSERLTTEGAATTEEATTVSETTTQAVTTTVPSTTTAPGTTTAVATTVPPTTTTTTTAATTSTTTTTATASATAATAASTTKTATTATTKATSTAASEKSQAAAPTSAKEILNRATLHPQKTNDPELDAAVQQIFSRIFTPGMTTYDKVLACYNYIINHAEYGRPKMTVTQEDRNAYQKEQDMWIVLFSKRILKNGQGVCDDYSALFLVMTRAIGLDCYYTHGYTTNTKGETKDHIWDTITVGGVDYIFDPQVEDKQSANGIKYTFFCQPYDSSIAKIYSGYDLAADKAAYNAFRKQGR